MEEQRYVFRWYCYILKSFLLIGHNQFFVDGCQFCWYMYFINKYILILFSDLEIELYLSCHNEWYLKKLWSQSKRLTTSMGTHVLINHILKIQSELHIFSYKSNHSYRNTCIYQPNLNCIPLTSITEIREAIQRATEKIVYNRLMYV